MRAAPNEDSNPGLDLKAFLQSSFGVFVLHAIERLIQLVVGMYVASSVAHAYTHADFALWQIAYSMWPIMVAFAAIAGERALMPRLCSLKGRERATFFNTGLAAKGIASVASAAAVMSWAYLLHHDGLFLIVMTFGIQVVLAELFSMSVHEAYSKDDFISPMVARLAGCCLRGGLAVIILNAHMALPWLAGAWVAEACLWGAILSRSLWKQWPGRGGRIDPSLLREIFVRGVALAVTGAAIIAVSRVDRIVLNSILDVGTLSQSAAAMTILEATFGFAGTLSVIVGAKTLFRMGPIPVRGHVNAVLMGLGISSFGALLIGLMAYPISSLVFGPTFEQTPMLLRHGVALLPLYFLVTLIQIPLYEAASPVFQVVKSGITFAVAAGVAWLAYSTFGIAWISAGAYAGFITSIAIDARELYRLRRSIYAS